MNAPDCFVEREFTCPCGHYRTTWKASGFAEAPVLNLECPSCGRSAELRMGTEADWHEFVSADPGQAVNEEDLYSKAPPLFEQLRNAGYESVVAGKVRSRAVERKRHWWSRRQVMFVNEIWSSETGEWEPVHD